MKLSKEDKLAILDYLMRHRLSNYGYEVKDWRRITSQRQRVKRAIRRLLDKCHAKGVPPTLLDYVLEHKFHWHTLPSRITVHAGVADYVVGQSANEEITNIMRRLLNPDAEWVS